MLYYFLKFQHLVSLDLSHNSVEVLVVSALRGLRELYAAHNTLQHLALHGAMLRILRAPYNREFNDFTYLLRIVIHIHMWVIVLIDFRHSTFLKHLL